jgi:hypothetical protein
MAVRETKTRKRHEEIYDEYLRLLGEFKAKYKEDTCSMSKKWIYTQVAENLGWSSDHVYHVVNKMIKCQ